MKCTECKSVIPDGSIICPICNNKAEIVSTGKYDPTFFYDGESESGEAPEYTQNTTDNANSDLGVLCRFCGKYVPSFAKDCPYCSKTIHISESKNYDPNSYYVDMDSEGQLPNIVRKDPAFVYEEEQIKKNPYLLKAFIFTILGITVAFIPIAIWIVLIPSLALTFAGMIYSGMAVDYSRNGFTGRHGSMALRIISTVFFVIEALGTLLSLLSCLTG